LGLIKIGKSHLLEKMSWICGFRTRSGLGTYCAGHLQTEMAYVPLHNIVTIIIYVTKVFPQVFECLLNLFRFGFSWHPRLLEDDKNRPVSARWRHRLLTRRDEDDRSGDARSQNSEF